MYSCSSFGIKVGNSLGTAICGWLMAAAGFVEKANEKLLEKQEQPQG